MTNAAPYPSIAAVGAEIGTLITSHIDHAFRRLFRGADVTIDRQFVRVITGEAHPFGNLACLTNPADSAAAAAAIDPLLACGAPSAVISTGPMSPPVAAHLQERGFQAHEGMPGMAVEIETLAATPLPAGYTFVRVGSGAEGDRWAEAFALGYELPRKVGDKFGPNSAGADKATDSTVQYFAIVRDGTYVCTSLVYLAQGVAGIYGVATLPKERGKGLGAHVTAEPLRLAHRLGYRVGILQASAAGHPVYRRLGFADFSEVPLYVRMPS